MRVEVRLANVLLADSERSDEPAELYVRTSNVPNPGADSADAPQRTCHDFATYLNAFSNEKWRRYTRIDNVWLHLRLRGAAEVTFTSWEPSRQGPQRTELGHTSAAAGEALDFCYPTTDAPFLSFEIVASHAPELVEGYYYTKVEQALVRSVELALATTTFRKEEFVVPNIELLRTRILGCDEPIARHFTLHVVDNGRTLDVAALEGERVHVHPNPNVGGSGGFARGMMEAMEQEPRATHVLLMDDDVRVHPEAIKRTYALLSLVRDEYRDAFASGAMLSLEQPGEFHEDTGWVRPDGTYGPCKVVEVADGDESHIDISTLEGMMRVETDDTPRENQYAGWWYCCIPVRCIERHGLPLPLFIRGDDGEYGNRAAGGFVTMNGICLWHMTFFDKFSASLDRYQFQRNSFIAQATTGVYEQVDFMVNFHYSVLLDLKTFNYDGAELSLRALEDYLRGPEFLRHVRGDELVRTNGRLNERLVPLDTIDDPEARAALHRASELYADEHRSVVTRLLDFVTYNGQRGPRALARGGLGVIPYNGWYYPPNEIRGKDTLLVVARDGEHGVLRKKDRARFGALLRRYQALRRKYARHGDEIRASWAAARGELTSVAFWKRYLEEQGAEPGAGAAGTSAGVAALQRQARAE